MFQNPNTLQVTGRFSTANRPPLESLKLVFTAPPAAMLVTEQPSAAELRVLDAGSTHSQRELHFSY